MSIINQALDKMKEARALEAAQRIEPIPATDARVGARPLQHDTGAAGVAAENAPDRIANFDRDVMQAAGIVPREADRAASAEQYRAIKQDLIRYVTMVSETAGELRQFIMVSSALPGDGKTFTSVNLAMSMVSERDFDVVLIDGDLAMRHLTRALGMADEPGLMDVLRDPSQSLGSVTYRTNDKRLHFVPAGNWSEDASELLASERMRELMAELRQRHPRRLVLMDSSPVLLSRDARVLAVYAGQVVLVVKAGNTLQADAKEAATQLSGENRRVTLVLNQLRPNDLLSSLAGYRYGYGYGYGSRAASDTAASTPE